MRGKRRTSVPFTAEYLRSVLNYNPVLGTFTWKVDRPNGSKAGQKAGCRAKKYNTVGVNGSLYRASNLAWMLMTGEYPMLEIDHANRIPWDDRWLNLRLASASHNAFNRTTKKRSGLPRGVHKCINTSGYQAMICVNYKQMHLGRFPTPEEAHKAYLAAVERYGRTAWLPQMFNKWPDDAPALIPVDADAEQELMELTVSIIMSGAPAHEGRAAK